MKVIIQDLQSKLYLSDSGLWISNAAEARDFFTLLRAYHFATDHTSRNFQVILHCPDDDYSAVMIGGTGMARQEIKGDLVSVDPVIGEKNRTCSVPVDDCWLDRGRFGRASNQLN